jgi:subtilisin family serine protease
VNPTSRNLTPVLAGLVLLSLILVAAPPIRPVSAAQGDPTGPSLHWLHLGYDKETGRQIIDPTARASASSSAAEEAEVEAFFTRKRERVDPTRITFRSGITIHPEPGMVAGAREALAASTDLGSGGFWLIQFRYPFPTEARYRLEDAGVAFYDYMDVAAFYAKVPPEAALLLESMLQEGQVRHVGGIPADAKVKPGLVIQATRSPTAEREIVVLTFDEPTPAQLEELGRWMAIERRSTGPIHIVEGWASGGSILALAKLGYVGWVEEASEATLGNLDGGMGVGADVVRYSGFDGTGVQVMVVDSGIARVGDTYHPDLQGDRILDQWDYQADEPDGDATDDYVLGNGHGTHVAGTIGGRYNAGDSNSDQSHQGVAPDASFLIYRLFGPDNSFSGTWFGEALDRATSGGRTAHVSNNSWGGSTSSDYPSYAAMADLAVRGGYNGQPVNMVTISQNQNRPTTAPGTGKNVITVGAVKDGNSPAGTLVWNSFCGDIDYNWPPGERVCYSNYGPIDTDGDLHTRVKPDLMAPGAMISSAVPWYPPFASNYYLSLHGTSHAAPHVTGAIAQLLEAYSVEAPWLFEWPEMVKAMLLASAVDVGGDTDYYGHGLLDAYHAIYAEPGIDEPMELWGGSVSASGETHDFSLYVPDGYDEVRVVLTWADPEGATEAINDLDVAWVKDGGGVTRDVADSEDDTVEYARILEGYAPGTWTIRVKAESVTSAQVFALAAHVILADADLSIRARPASIPGTVPSFGPGGEFYLHQYVSNSGYTAGGSYARLHAPEGFTVMGVTVYTQDGYEHWYDASELYYDPVEDDFYVALGETLTKFERHVRWHIDIDGDTECGGYLFESTAYWLEGGDEHASSTVNAQVPVACHFVYLPLVLRGD